jgi:hypothetical protein
MLMFENKFIEMKILLKLNYSALLLFSLSILISSCSISNKQKNTSNKDLRDYYSYLIDKPVSFIITTDPEETIKNHGIQLSKEHLKEISSIDSIYLKDGFYHLFKIPNSGNLKIEWTGYADGNGQIWLHFWNGNSFDHKDIREAFQSKTYDLNVNLPQPDYEYVYVMVNCTSGKIYTDAIKIINIDKN